MESIDDLIEEAKKEYTIAVEKFENYTNSLIEDNGHEFNRISLTAETLPKYIELENNWRECERKLGELVCMKNDKK